LNYLNLLKKFLTTTEHDGGHTVHDLVREQLKHESVNKIISLKNISAEDFQNNQLISESSPVHKTFVAAEKKLKEVLNEEDEAKAELKALEKQDDEIKVSWTDAIKQDDSPTD
jgi:hypothetical protein